MCQRETPYEYVCTSICVLEVEIDCVCLSVHGCGYMCVPVLGAVCARACGCREFYVPTPGPEGYDEGLRGNPRLDGGVGGSDPAPRRVSLEEEGIKSVCSYAEAL